jgi:raffinose/stachyose/melibiose transport system permease protein
MKSTILKQQNMGWRIWAYSTMIFFTLLTIGPLVWLVLTSFRPNADIVRSIIGLPKSFYVENYIQTWKLGKFGILMLNSILYSTTATITTTLLALMAGYGFSKFGYKISGIFYFFFMMGILITVHSILVPLFVLETKIGIDNTRIGIIIPYIAVGLPFLVFLSTSYIKGIPNSIEEAARIDGAGYLTIFWYVILPVARPVMATMAIFSFLGNWNEFVLVFVLTSKGTLRSLPVGINAFAGGRAMNYAYMFTALVVGTIPMILFYVFFHRQLARGFAAGSLKE